MRSLILIWTCISVIIVVTPIVWSAEAKEQKVEKFGSGSCDIRAVLGYCYEYRGDAWSESEARSQCDGSPGGTYSTSSCPSENQVGRCSFYSAEKRNNELIYYYYSPTFDKKTAKWSCAGDFTAP